MSKNKIKEPIIEEAPDAEAPKKTPRKGKKFIRYLNVFGIFNRDQIVHVMPFILFLTVLILFYIANSYYAERLIREINTVKNDLKERHAEYISTSSELMFRMKQSEVAKAIGPMELKESVDPQKKVEIQVKKKKQ
jgi:hypothetical protein